MNNPLVDLEERLRTIFPDSSIERDRTRDTERFGTIDVRQGARLIVVMWTPDDGICVTEVGDDSVFDDAPGYVVSSIDEALQILSFLLGASDLKDMDGVDVPARKAA